MIVDVLVSKGNRRHALRHQCADIVNRALRIAFVDKTPRKPVENFDRSIGLAQQQSAGIRRNGSAVESSNSFAPVEAFKFELFGVTVCLHRTPYTNMGTLCCKSSFSDSWGQCTPLL